MDTKDQPEKAPSGRRAINKVWIAIGGLAGLVAIIGVIIAGIQLWQSMCDSIAQNKAHATLVTVLEAQYQVQSEIATLQSENVNAAPTATVVAQKLVQLEKTIEALEQAKRQAEATLTPVAEVSPGGTATPTTPTPYFEETFASIENLAQRWDISENGGQLVPLYPGIRLEQGRTNKYPYLISRTNPFPLTGDFDVKISLRYNDLTYYGTGLALSVCCQLNAQVPSTSESKTLVALWQDLSEGIRVERWNYSSVRDPFYFLGEGTTSQELQQVLIQYQSDSNLLTVSINGEKVPTMQAAQRPDRIWLGNPFIGESPWDWSTLEVISILVVVR